MSLKHPLYYHSDTLKSRSLHPYPFHTTPNRCKIKISNRIRTTWNLIHYLPSTMDTPIHAAGILPCMWWVQCAMCTLSSLFTFAQNDPSPFYLTCKLSSNQTRSLFSVQWNPLCLMVRLWLMLRLRQMFNVDPTAFLMEQNKDGTCSVTLNITRYKQLLSLQFDGAK